MLPGAEVLFAFLLTLPFSQRFGEIAPFERNVYFATLLCSAATTALLIAPSAHRRLAWSRHGHPRQAELERANRLVIAGALTLALAIVGVLYLVASLLFDDTLAAGVSALAGGVFAWLWFGLPLLRKSGVRSEK
jgi:predicted neutral ceramidase superfamily lipid hydrolase